MSAENPFIQVYDALWDLLESHKDWAELGIPIGSRIKYRGVRRSPQKSEISTADLPEIAIVPLTTTPHVQRSSSSMMVIKRFGVQYVTGEQRIDTLFAIEFETHRAMSHWPDVLKVLTWKSHPFCHFFRQTDVTDGMDQQQAMRGIAGWVAIWACEVHMNFPLSLLQGD
jgi:hypothetical protein